MKPPKPKNNFGTVLRNHRLARDMTQEELGNAIGVDVRSVQRWERGLTTPQPRKRREIRLVLGLDATAYIELGPTEKAIEPRSTASVSDLEFESLSLSEYLRRGGDASFAQGQVESIIAEWSEPPGENNFMGTDEKWRDVSLTSPDTHFYLIENGRDVVGTWSLVPINDDLYRDALAGENVNCKIRPADIHHPLPGDQVSAYFVDFFRSRRTSPVLFLAHFLSSIQTLLQDWSRFGVKLQYVVAHLSTSEIIGLVDDRFGFRFVTEHSCHTMYDRDNNIVPSRVYELDVLASLRGTRRVRRLIRDAGVLAAYDPDLLPD